MIKILVPAKDPTVIEAISEAFIKFFNETYMSIESVEPNSGVKDLPNISYEALVGATNRAKNAKRDFEGYDYYIGTESGIEYIDNEIMFYVWIVVLHQEKMGKARSLSYLLPSTLKFDLEKGMPLSQALENIYGKGKINENHGIVALYSKELITIKDLIEDATILAISSLFYK